MRPVSVALPRIEVPVVVDAAVAADDPVPVERVERLRRPAADLVVERAGAAVRARQDLLLERRRATALQTSDSSDDRQRRRDRG